MNWLTSYQWEIFITLELLSLFSFLLFGVVRYWLDRKKQSQLYIVGFFLFLILEVLLAFILYNKTGEISAFQIVIAIFLLYACTFGVGDFRRLDRWMRQKIGDWRGMELLTKKDHETIKREEDPTYIAKKHRWSATIHFVIFVLVQLIFWFYGTADLNEMLLYVKDLSWIETGNYEDSPYPNEALYAISMVWMIAFAVDFIWSWSYTFFPSKKKD